VAEIGVVAADRSGVDELRAAERGEGVDEHDDRLGCELVDLLGNRPPPRAHVEPRRGEAGEALQEIDGGVALLARVVGRRRPYVRGALVRIAERVVAQRLARERELLPAARKRYTRGAHGAWSRSSRSLRAPPIGIRSCASVSRSRIVTWPSSSVSWSMVSA